jgi:hypothetical protein
VTEEEIRAPAEIVVRADAVDLRLHDRINERRKETP